jgi:hypothetical protein
MSKGSRVAIVAGIIIAAVIGAFAVATMTTNPMSPEVQNNNGTNSTGRNFVVELNENIEIRENSN